MPKTATLTSKRQLTLPKEIFIRLAPITSRRFNIELKQGKLVLTPVDFLVEQLAGSLEIPARWRNRTADEIISQSKKEYFSQEKK